MFDGKELVVADTLSRCPNPSEKSDTEDEVEAYVDAIKMTIPATDRQLKIIERANAEDGQQRMAGLNTTKMSQTT